MAQKIIPSSTLSAVTNTVQQIDNVFKGAAKAVQAEKVALIKASQTNPTKPVLQDQLKAFDSTVPLVSVPTDKLPQQGPLLLMASAALDVLSDGLVYWWVVLLVILAYLILRFVLRRARKKSRRPKEY